MANTTTAAKIEYERLFGKNVDIFKNYYACLGIYNILKHIGVETSSDSDWFRAVAKYITQDELKAVQEKIMPLSQQEKEIGASSRYRGVPDWESDDPDDIIRLLTKNVIHRKKMWIMAQHIYAKRVAEYKKLLDAEDHVPSAIEKRFKEMSELFEFSEKEMHIIAAIFLAQTRFVEYGDFDINRFCSSEKITSLARILDCLDIEAAELIGQNHNIYKYGLIDEDLDMDKSFLSYLAGINPIPLAERFWKKYDGDVLPWEFHGRLAEKNGTVLKEMINAKKDDKGLSVMLFGVPGSGKTSFAASLAADMGKTLYFIAQNDEESRFSRVNYSVSFRYAALAVAQKQLDPNKVILVVDECDKMVENTSLGGSFLSRIFGSDPVGGRDGESKAQLNSVIDNNKHTILWIANSKQEAIDPSSRRRFDYNIFFDELPTNARTHIWHNVLKHYNCEDRLDEYFIKHVSSVYKVNPGGIDIAVKNAAAVCNANKDLDFQTQVMFFLKAHCSFLGIQESVEGKMEPARDYSLEGLNIRSGIKLPRLINACQKFLNNESNLSANRDQPRMNLLLFGVPGAGKTEFVKYLAKQLNRKLCIKNASDLLNMYVGGTEQRIAAAFAEAELNKEILFIDEGDSLLGARDGAVKSWEVSQVNTLLAEMERFRGIFIVGTNLIQKLDQAALRRFSFRLHFDYLTNEGKEIFFETYFSKPMGLPKLNDDEKKMLFAIDSMTPSDFRNVRQQFFYLADEKLSNMEIIEALQSEIISKTSGSSYKGLGNVVQKMGF